MILASRRGDVTIVDRLLSKGIHPDTPGEHELNHERALTIAAERGYEDIVRLLLEYSATVNLHSSPLWSKSALSAAALQGHASICELLFDQGADVQPLLDGIQRDTLFTEDRAPESLIAGHSDAASLLFEQLRSGEPEQGSYSQ